MHDIRRMCNQADVIILLSTSKEISFTINNQELKEGSLGSIHPAADQAPPISVMPIELVPPISVKYRYFSGSAGK